MELLHALGVVHGQGAVPVLGQNQEEAQGKAGGKAPGRRIQCGRRGHASDGFNQTHGV